MNSEKITKIIQQIQDSKSPLILIGAAAVRKGISQSLRALIDQTGIPFFDSQLSKGVVDERHALYLGTAAVSANDSLHEAIATADLIINVGDDVYSKPTFVIQKEVTEDISDMLEPITKGLTKQAHWDFSRFKKVEEQTDFVSIIRKIIPEDGIVCLDNGLYKLWFARNYKCYQPNTLLLDNSLATMGAGLPSAIAAKLLYPNKKVLAVIGDGGFMMSAAELETAKRLNLDLVVLILNDNGFGMIKWKQDMDGFARFGLDFGNPDFVKFAESFGVSGYRADESQLESVLDKCLSSQGIHVIEAPIDYSKNVWLSNL